MVDFWKRYKFYTEQQIIYVNFNKNVVMEALEN